MLNGKVSKLIMKHTSAAGTRDDMKITRGFG